ncbi:CstA-like transporter-associated (seleno)protein [Rothia nasimurium]|uniref:YbdD/YjiX family protein n=1 Tax=Luteibacter anthropi TaxID=564369 RepID=A0A7X5U9P3_9GAMM|nr:YbdD/YjiX family protein [Luteibacter anthropi]NII06491.1 YbdD/YjiX family protein [Luteibacter anthropi]
MLKYPKAFWRWAVQTARLCCGVPDYDAYVRHLREHHPECPVPSYGAFFRERQEARYRGTGGRCC